MEHKQIIIIGGGISGLSFAKYCSQQIQDVLLLEKSHRLGGCIDTLSDSHGLLLEQGTHTFYRIYTACYDLLSPALKRKIFANPPFKNFVDAEGKTFPFIQKLDPWSLWRMPAFLWTRPQQKDLSTFFTPLLGKKNRDQLLEPAFDALYCQPSAHYPAELLFKRRDRKTLAHLPKAFFLEGGMQAMIEDIAVGIDYRLNQKITDITYENNRYYLTINDSPHPAFSCDVLAMGPPPEEAMGLLKNIHPSINFPQIKNNSFMTLSIVYEAKNAVPLEAGLIGWKSAIYSAIYAKRLPEALPNYHGASLHFRDPTIDPKKALALATCYLGISPDNIVHHHIKTNQLPCLRPDHLPQIRSLDTQLPPHLVLLGNYFGGFSIEDCVNRSHFSWERLREWRFN